MSTVITLNVGGTLFTTTINTLKSCPDSKLARLVTCALPAVADSQGHLFIDRDPAMFSHVLNFLRSHTLCLPKGFTDWTLLRQEADFYQVGDLVRALGEVTVKVVTVEVSSNIYDPLNVIGKKEVLEELFPNVRVNYRNGNLRLNNQRHDYPDSKKIPVERLVQHLVQTEWTLVSSTGAGAGSDWTYFKDTYIFSTHLPIVPVPKAYQ